MTAETAENTPASPAQSSTDPAPNLWQQIASLLPGLLLTAAVAWIGLWASEWVGASLLGFDKSPVSGIMMAIVVGLVIGNTLPLPAQVRPGIRFSLKKVLKFGIILLGIRLSLGDVLRLGAMGIPLIVFCIAGALVISDWLGKRLNLSSRMSTLIGVGTSICGATAIVATGPAIDAKEEELAYAVANITVFGILAMFIYPYLAHAVFPDDMTGAGLFLGTAIHETAQVAGGGLIYADLFDAEEALEAATVTKLVRNVLIAVVIPLMAYRYRQQTSEPGKTRRVNVLSLFPIFILGFLLLAVIRTIGDTTLDSGSAFGLLSASQWDSVVENIKGLAELCLAVAMAGVGLGTSVRQLRGLGLKPFYVGLGASVSVGVLSLVGIGVLNLLGVN